MISKCESSISFFFVHEERSYKTESIWPKIVTSAVTAIFKKLTLIYLEYTTKITTLKHEIQEG